MNSVRIGILGDGQLAKMLLEAAYTLGISPVVFADSSDSSLSKICSHIVHGSRNNPRDLRKFLAKVDFVTYESEFFDKKYLEEAAHNSKGSALFCPSLDTMEKLRDKLIQKQILKSLKIPSADFVELKGHQAISPWLDVVHEKYKGRFVLKWGRLGYDGKGVYFPNSKNGKDALSFCEHARQADVSVFAEERIEFERELSITGCYSTKKEFVSYPLVISKQKDGICTQILGPATALGVNVSLEEKAKQYAQKLARNLTLYGSFSIEFFESRKGGLLVNELAPRVHNSAHYSQNASFTSQFENHLRAILGFPLGSTESAPFFSMLNLLGPKGIGEVEDAYCPRPRVTSDVHLHWYGKALAKSGRKLGHLNGVGCTHKDKNKVLNQLRRVHLDWLRRFKEKKK